MLLPAPALLYLSLNSLLTNALPAPDDESIPYNLLIDPAPIKLDICSLIDYQECHMNLHPEPNKCYTTYTYLEEKNGYKVASMALGEGTSCTLYASVECKTYNNVAGFTFALTQSMGNLLQDSKRTPRWPFAAPFSGAGVLSFKCWRD